MTDRSMEPLSRHELRQLLLAVRRGEEGAFSCLYGKYLPLVLRLSTEFVPRYASHADAEDFRQEAMLALYRAALAYDLEQREVEFGLFAKNHGVILVKKHNVFPMSVKAVKIF